MNTALLQLRPRLAKAAFVAVCCIHLPCQSSTFDAEERAYLKQFQSAAVGGRCREAIENSYDQAKFRDVQDPKKLNESQQELGRLIGRVQAVAKANIQRLEVALPPESMRETYLSRIHFLRYVASLSLPLEPAQVEEFISRCRSLYLKNLEAGRKLAERPPAPPVHGTTRLTYEPPLLPVSYNLVDGSFTVKKSIATPLGNLTLGYTNSSGAKLLIIRSGGRERYFELDQAFEVFVPASYGVLIRTDGRGTIALEVVAR